MRDPLRLLTIVCLLMAGSFTLVAFIMTPVRTWKDLVALPLVGLGLGVAIWGTVALGSWLLSLLPPVFAASVVSIAVVLTIIAAMRAKMRADRKVPDV